MDSAKKIEEKLIDFLYSQVNKNTQSISKEDLIVLNELINNHSEYFKTLMNIIKFRFVFLNNIEKIAILIQMKNFLTKFLKKNNKSYSFYSEIENNVLTISKVFCSIEKDKKVRMFLKTILMKMIKISMKNIMSNVSKGN